MIAFFYVLITAIFLTFVFILFGMFKLLLIYKQNINVLNSNISSNFKETLELATSEQLLKELRKRKNIPFVILFPVKEKDYNGIKIETHSMNSMASLAMLHLAREIAIQNMKRKGEETPQFPSLDDYFGEEE